MKKDFENKAVKPKENKKVVEKKITKGVVDELGNYLFEAVITFEDSTKKIDLIGAKTKEEAEEIFRNNLKSGAYADKKFSWFIQRS